MLIFVFELRFCQAFDRPGWRGREDTLCAAVRLKDAHIMQGAAGSKGWRRSGVLGDRATKAGAQGRRGFGRRNVTILDCSEISSLLSVGDAFL